MTPAEFQAAQVGYENDEEARLKELVWKISWTMRPVKHPPSRAKLYKQLTGKAWNHGKQHAKQDRQAGQEKARSLLRGLTVAGNESARTPQDRARELGEHISERRKGHNGR